MENFDIGGGKRTWNSDIVPLYRIVFFNIEENIDIWGAQAAKTLVLERSQYQTRYHIQCKCRYMIFNFKTGPNVPFPPFVHSNEENKMDFGDLSDYMDQDIPARQYPTAKLEFGPIAQFLTDMPY